MVTVTVRLRTILPRWLLSVDPYVRVNDGPSKRLTKEPVEFDVPAGRVCIEAAMFSTDLRALERDWKSVASRLVWRTPVSSFVADVGENELLRLSFHKVFFTTYWIRGRFRRE